MISQDEEREGALYVRQKEDDNDAKKWKGDYSTCGPSLVTGRTRREEDKYVKERKRG
jgi:hypothetical protein